MRVLIYKGGCSQVSRKLVNGGIMQEDELTFSGGYRLYSYLEVMYC